MGRRQTADSGQRCGGRPTRGTERRALLHNLSWLFVVARLTKTKFTREIWREVDSGQGNIATRHTDHHEHYHHHSAFHSSMLNLELDHQEAREGLRVLASAGRQARHDSM